MRFLLLKSIRYLKTNTNSPQNTLFTENKVAYSVNKQAGISGEGKGKEGEEERGGRKRGDTYLQACS